MQQPALFTLVTFGTDHLGYRGLLSAYRDNGTLEQFLSLVNAELGRLPRDSTDARARRSALEVLRRHGFGKANATGWFEDPRG